MSFASIWNSFLAQALVLLLFHNSASVLCSVNIFMVRSKKQSRAVKYDFSRDILLQALNKKYDCEIWLQRNI